MHGSVTVKEIWKPQSNYSDDAIIMDRVLELNVPMEAIKKINICRLHKEYYHITDILDSMQKY